MMAYNYQTERPKLFSEENQALFLKIRDNAERLCKEAGCAMEGKIISGNSGDSWTMMACVDRLVELGELQEVHYGPCAGQHRIFFSMRFVP